MRLDTKIAYHLLLLVLQVFHQAVDSASLLSCRKAISLKVLQSFKHGLYLLKHIFSVPGGPS